MNQLFLFLGHVDSIFLFMNKFSLVEEKGWNNWIWACDVLTHGMDISIFENNFRFCDMKFR